MKLLLAVPIAVLAAAIAVGGNARTAPFDETGTTGATNATAATAGGGYGYIAYAPAGAPSVTLSPHYQVVNADQVYEEDVTATDPDEFQTGSPPTYITADNGGDIAFFKYDTQLYGQHLPCASTTLDVPQFPYSTSPWSWEFLLTAKEFPSYPTYGVDIYLAQDESGGAWAPVNDNWTANLQAHVKVEAPVGGTTGTVTGSTGGSTTGSTGTGTATGTTGATGTATGSTGGPTTSTG